MGMENFGGKPSERTGRGREGGMDKGCGAVATTPDCIRVFFEWETGGPIRLKKWG